MTIGNTTNASITGQQPYQPSASTPLSLPINVANPIAPSLQLQLPSQSSCTPLIPHQDSHDSSNNSNQTANLVKPSFFVPTPTTSSTMMIPPVSLSAPTAPPPQPAVNVQRPYGTPLLQPFPPPTPPPSLTPASTPPPSYGPVITREKVQQALLVLVQVSLLPHVVLVLDIEF